MPKAELLPAELPDGSGFSKQLSDPAAFASKLADVVDLGALCKAALRPHYILFSRRALDGSTLRLEREPPGKAASVEYRLVKQNGNKRELVWTASFVDLVALGHDDRRCFTFWDAVEAGDKIFVLASRKFVPQVDVMTRGPNGEWHTVVEVVFDDVAEADAVAEFYRDPESGRLGIQYKDSPAHERRWVGFDQVREKKSGS